MPRNLYATAFALFVTLVLVISAAAVFAAQVQIQIRSASPTGPQVSGVFTGPLEVDVIDDPCTLRVDWSSEATINHPCTGKPVSLRDLRAEHQCPEWTPEPRIPTEGPTDVPEGGS
jgi:hypothetical protein